MWAASRTVLPTSEVAIGEQLHCSFSRQWCVTLATAAGGQIWRRQVDWLAVRRQELDSLHVYRQQHIDHR
jgi:hypothetical protein